MNQAQAKRKLKELAKGKCLSLTVEWTIYSSGHAETQYGVYIDKMPWYHAPTWEEAFEKLEAELEAKGQEFSEFEGGLHT